MIKASVSVHCPGETLADVREFAGVLKRLGIDGMAVLNGGSVLGATVADLDTAITAQCELGDDAVFAGAGGVWVNVAALRTGLIECGSHVGSLPCNVLVEVNSECLTCDTA
jgi:hypothetical protein